MTTTTAQKVKNPTRRGDAVLIERTQHSFVIGEGSKETTDYVVMFVASATREGTVSKVADHSGSFAMPIPSYWGNGRHWIMTKQEVDVAGLLAAFEARTWPTGSTGRYPFSTFDDAKAFCSRFRTS